DPCAPSGSRSAVHSVDGSESRPYLRLIQLDVPVEIIAPAFGRVAEAYREAHGGRLRRSLRRPHERHPGLIRRASALAPVARAAGGDDVLPGLASALGDRDDVIEREVLRMMARAAVLAGVLVACVDVRAGEGHVVERPSYPDATQEAYDRRQLEADGHRPYLPVV